LKCIVVCQSPLIGVGVDLAMIEVASNLFFQSPLIGVGVDQPYDLGEYIIFWSPPQGVGGGKLVPSVPVLSLVFSIPVRASRRRCNALKISFLIMITLN
jgi:hypothetical protein